MAKCMPEVRSLLKDLEHFSVGLMVSGGNYSLNSLKKTLNAVL